MENSVVYDRINDLQAGLATIHSKLDALQRSLPQNIRPSKAIKARNANIALGSTNVVICNVSGKGTLYHAIATHPYNWSVKANITIKITIDGKTIQCGATRTGSKYSIGYLSKDCLMAYGDASSQRSANIWLENFVADNDGTDYPPMTVEYPFVKLYESTSVVEGNVILYSERGLSFESSLVVTVSNPAVNDRDTRCDASVSYVLED